MTNENGLLVVVSGPSGAGKGTVLAQFLAENPNAWFSVSATTRAPRPGEEHGIHYMFTTREEFQKLIRSHGVLEYTEYNGNYYGTPKEPITEKLAEGRDVLLDIEVDGAQQVRSRCPQALTVFLMPPTFAELEKRLRARGTETPEQIENRLARAREEMLLAPDYDYIIVNDRVEDAARQLAALIAREKENRAK